MEKGQTEIKLLCPEKAYIQVPKERIGVVFIKFLVKYKEYTSTIPLEYGSLAKTKVAFGISDSPLGKVVVSIVEGKAEPATFSAKILPGKGGNGKYIELTKE